MAVQQIARKPAAAEAGQPPEAVGSVPGHNRLPPQEQGVADFVEAIDAHEGIRQRIRDLLSSSTRAQAVDDETAGRCAELIRQMTAVEKVVDGERTRVKAPYLDAGRRIDDTAKSLVYDLGLAKAKVRGLAEDYMRQKAAREAAERRRQEEEARQQREAAERLAREEAARAEEENRLPDPEIMEAPIAVTARPVAEAPAQVRSDFGALASTRKVKVAIVTDWPKAFKAVKSVPAVQEAIQKAINGLVRAGQTNIPGVEIKDDIGLSVR